MTFSVISNDLISEAAPLRSAAACGSLFAAVRRRGFAVGRSLFAVADLLSLAAGGEGENMVGMYTYPA